MSRRASVQPRWLDTMLMMWGRELPTARGWHNTCPMLQSGIPASKPAYEPWDLQPRDFDNLVTALDELMSESRKHWCVIRLYYKPWTAAEMNAELAQYSVGERTIQRWLHDAAAMLEAKMVRMKEAA